MKPAIPLTALLGLVVAGWAGAQTTAQLAAPAQSISDEAIQRDHSAYEAMQSRIKALNDRGRPVRDYHLAKAQCWLDVSFHEYTRNDRSAFPQAALTESEKLIVAMEAGQQPLPTDTPLVNGAARLRPDLWDAAQALRAHPGARCATRQVACAEVELVHAGNEFNQQQWRHAKPYVQIAEDLLGQAQQQAEACVPRPSPPPPPAPVAPPPPAAPSAPALVAPPPPPAAPPVQEFRLAAQVLFNFDKHDLRNVRAFSIAQIDDLLRRIREERLVVTAIRLSGHADRLNGTGQDRYNQRLSERRVATVRDELLRRGIEPALIDTAASGDTRQVTGCEQRFSRTADLQECLLPNRRVDIVIEARRR